MGLFDWLTGARSGVFQAIVDYYGLKRTPSYERSITFPWWEGLAGTTPFAIQEVGGRLQVYVGEIVEVTEIYLIRGGPQQPLPAEGSPGRLDRIAGKETLLARQFFLAAYPVGDFDYPQLRVPAVAEGIVSLSSCVREVAICENFRGLCLGMDPPPAREEFDRDLRWAIGIVNALAAL